MGEVQVEQVVVLFYDFKDLDVSALADIVPTQVEFPQCRAELEIFDQSFLVSLVERGVDQGESSQLRIREKFLEQQSRRSMVHIAVDDSEHLQVPRRPLKHDLVEQGH